MSLLLRVNQENHKNESVLGKYPVVVVLFFCVLLLIMPVSALRYDIITTQGTQVPGAELDRGELYSITLHNENWFGEALVLFYVNNGDEALFDENDIQLSGIKISYGSKTFKVQAHDGYGSAYLYVDSSTSSGIYFTIYPCDPIPPPILSYPKNDELIWETNPTFEWNNAESFWADNYNLVIRDDTSDPPHNVYQSYEHTTISGDTTSHSLPSGILNEGNHYSWSMNSNNPVTGWGSYSSREYFWIRGQREYTFGTTDDLAKITIEGVEYPSPTEIKFYDDDDHTVSVPKEQWSGNGMKYIFKKWDDGVTSNARIIHASPDTQKEYNAEYERTYGVTVESDPEYVHDFSQYSKYYPVGTQFSIEAPVEIPDNGNIWFFEKWLVGTQFDNSNPLSVTVDETKYITAWYELYTPPTVRTIPATEVSSTSAKLIGNLNALGTNDYSVVWFEYGTTKSSLDSSTSTSSQYSIGQFSTQVQNLYPGTTYYYRACAASLSGYDQYGETLEFTTPVEKSVPTVSTQSASGVSATTATLNGYLDNTGGLSCKVWFKYGKTASLEFSPTSQQDRTSIGQFNTQISSLNPGNKYYYQAWASNSMGQPVWGQVLEFTTSVDNIVPAVSTQSASGISATTATLNGYLDNTGGLPCKVWFKYGKTASLELTPTSQQDRTSTGQFNTQITSLNPGIKYFFQAWASNSMGQPVSGQVLEFTTSVDNTVPAVSTQSASGVSATTATLNGYLDNTGGLPCKVWFKYGKTASLELTPTSQRDRTSTGQFNAQISSLNPGTKYYYQAWASNSMGQPVSGQLLDFTTISTSTIVGKWMLDSQVGKSDDIITWNFYENGEWTDTHVFVDGTSWDYDWGSWEYIGNNQYNVQKYSTSEVVFCDGTVLRNNLGTASESAWHRITTVIFGPPLNGDLNGNGILDSGDTTLLMRKIVGLDLPGDYPLNGDLNGNGILDSGDTTLLMRTIVGLDS